MHRPKLVTVPKKARNGDDIMKEQLVVGYIHKIGFVDKNDAVTSQHSMVRKAHKWTTKCAFHLLEEVMFNAHVLHVQTAADRVLSYTDFKLMFIEETFKKIDAYKALYSQPTTGAHDPEPVPATKSDQRRAPTKRCVHCYKLGIRRESRYQCDTCLVHPGLCVYPCFRDYHTPDGEQQQ